MAVITLKKGSSTGAASDFALGFIDLDALTEGTDYAIAGKEEITLTIGGKLKVAEVNLTSSGLQYLNIEAADDLLPVGMSWDVGDTEAGPSGTWTEAEPIGTKPADWDLHWRDKYYTQSTYNYDGHDITTYNAISYPGTWSNVVQYYENGDHAALYWTPNGGVFGVRQLYESAAGGRAGIIAGGMFGAWGNSDGGSDGALAPRLKGISGQQVGGDIIFNAPAQAYYPYRSEYVGGGATQDDTFKGRCILLEIIYEGETYIGFAVLGYDAGGDLVKCGFWMSGQKFWISDDIEPGTPGDWGARSGALNPSGGGIAVFNSIDIPAINGALNSSGYGGTHGGVYWWALTKAQFGALNSCIWDQSFLERIMHYGKNPGDGIIAAHILPGHIPHTTPAGNMHLYGIFDLKDGLTDVKGCRCSARLYDVDCGSIYIDPLNMEFSDYDASAEIYLPFIGTQVLDIRKIMRATLHLVYRFDIVTGDCAAMLTAQQSYPDGYHSATGKCIILSAQGHAGRSEPYAYTDGGVQAKLSALSGALAAGLSAAMGNPAGIMSGAMGLLNMGKETISHSSLTGNSAAMCSLTPYVWLKYPEPVNPSSYEETVGRVSETGGTVGTMTDDNLGREVAYSGYQRYSSVDVEGIPCTQEEAAEIETMLKGGVFL